VSEGARNLGRRGDASESTSSAKNCSKPAGMISRSRAGHTPRSERVPLISGLEDRVTRRAEHNFGPKQRADEPLRRAVFVLKRGR